MSALLDADQADTEPSTRSCADCGIPTHIGDLAPTIACDTYRNGELCPQDWDAHVTACRDCRCEEYAHAEREAAS